MKSFISSESYALAHYYLAQCKGVPVTPEVLIYYRNLCLRHLPEDQVTLLRRPGLQFSEEDFSDEVKEIAHHLARTLK